LIAGAIRTSRDESAQSTLVVRCLTVGTAAIATHANQVQLDMHSLPRLDSFVSHVFESRQSRYTRVLPLVVMMMMMTTLLTNRNLV
jgi:hypothetical protein